MAELQIVESLSPKISCERSRDHSEGMVTVTTFTVVLVCIVILTTNRPDHSKGAI